MTTFASLYLFVFMDEVVMGEGGSGSAFCSYAGWFSLCSSSPPLAPMQIMPSGVPSASTHCQSKLNETWLSAFSLHFL